MDKKQQGLSTVGWISLIGIGVVVLVLVALQNNMISLPQNLEDTQNVLGLSQEERLLDRITENPIDFVGQTVEVDGEIEDVFSSRSFLIDAPGLVNDTLLVVTKEPFDIQQMEQKDADIDGKVRINGMVRQFQIVEALDSLDPDLDPNMIAVYEGQPYIEAESISFLQ